MLRWIIAIMLLPFNAVVLMPVIFMFLGDYSYATQPNFFVAIGILLIAVGLFFGVWTTILLGKIGKGTLAPWSPTRKLVVRGPYKYSRNPMLTASIAILLGESLLLGSPQILLWTAIFSAIALAFMLFVEEDQLYRRFGADYALYRSSVPRFIPRITPWKLPNAPKTERRKRSKA